jgi:hypothetical protein
VARPPRLFRAFEVQLDLYPGSPLMVKRAPLYLRFVRRGDDSRTLDCLDQLDDEPKPAEEVIAAERVSSSAVHYKFAGRDKHKSGWYLWVQYAKLPDQPPPEVLRDTASWRQWCRDRAARSPTPSGKPLP